jgi:hypothetical protein
MAPARSAVGRRRMVGEVVVEVQVVRAGDMALGIGALTGAGVGQVERAVEDAQRPALGQPGGERGRVDQRHRQGPGAHAMQRRYHSWKCCMPSSIGLW